MESEAKYVRVGIATIVLAALLAAGLFWLAGRSGQQAQDRYVVYFRKQSLEGLQINSDVRMQGVKVGKVIDYSIIPGEAHKVRVLLQVDARTPVMQGVHAIVSRQLVTGLAAIDLENPPQATERLTHVPPGEQYPVIPEGVSQLTKVTDTLEALSKNSQEALTRLNELLSERNQKAIAGTLSNISAVTGELKAAMPDVRATVISIGRAADQIDGLGAQARVSLKQTTTHLGKVADNTAATLARVDREMAELSSQLKLTTDLAGQDIQATAQSLRGAGDALNASGRALSKPSRVLFGPSPQGLGPGEEIHK